MIGKKISNYKIIEKIGEGGMGVVYKAEDKDLIRMVALKFLSKDLTQRADARERFVNEARAAANLDHPNICAIHEIGETKDGQMFFVMAYCEGETLKQKIASGSLKLKNVLDYSIQTARGLAEAHEKGIIHRDIKPSNLIVTKNEVVKILDFGLARVANVDLNTKTGARFGTLSYMSPEQASGKTVDHRTDIWSFGVSMYEMLTGQLPFQRENEAAVLLGIINEQAQPIAETIRDIPVELERIVTKSMAKRADYRYQHVDDMLVDLRHVYENMFGRRHWYGLDFDRALAKRGTKTLLISGVIVLLLLIVSVGYWFFVHKRSTAPVPIAVADFINETDEEELDGLSGMLITALEQSHRLSVLTRSRMYDIFNQITSEDIDHIDEATARKICEHADINALAIASIRKFDNLYTIDLKVIEPKEDRFLFTAMETGEGKKNVPTMIDNLSRKTERGLKIADVDQAPRQKVADITTFDLEAYHHFFKGLELWYKMQDDKALEEMHRAIAIDSTFGMAYALVAIIYVGTPNEHLAREPLSKALKYINRTPEKERYLIRAFDGYLRKGPQAAIAELRKMAEIYPDDKRVYLGLGYFHYRLAEFELAKANFEKVLQLDPVSEMAQKYLSEMVSALK